MNRFITIALRKDGTAEMLHGPEVPGAIQRATVQKYRDTDTPEGIERVEIWAKPLPPIKFACKKPAPPKVEEQPKPPCPPKK